MTVRVLHDTWEGANSEESKTITYKRLYECDSYTEYINMTAWSPRKGHVLHVHGIGYFWVESCSLPREGSAMQNGKLQFWQEYKLRIPMSDEIQKMNLPPWCYPPQDVSFTSGTEEFSVTQIYLPDSLQPVPFVNSAGVPLEASGQKGILQLSFNFNSLYFSPRDVWSFKGVVNAYPLTILDLGIPARTAYMENYSGTEQIEYDENGYEKWRYWKISVSILLHPEGWDKKYLNVGTHVRTGGGLAQLWRWNNGATYGTYYEYLDSGEEDGEAVNEPMFLTPDGSGINPFRNGKQVESYLTGCVYYPADWSYLDLPTTRNWRT